ncbi:MAG: hypothetical protein R3249_10895 [Nitriliruptorales bacterium]|nr:hypothetical protein [Nitriliruptorales bacterium]
MIPIPACSVLVAPRDARLASCLPADSAVNRGDVVAVLEAGDDRLTLIAPEPGVVGGPLVGERQALASGDAVAWLRR